MSLTFPAISAASLSTDAMLLPYFLAFIRYWRISGSCSKLSRSAATIRSASSGLSASSASIAANESATTDRPWIRQPLPLYFVPCFSVSLVSTPVSIPPISVERNGTCKIEIALDAALAHSTIWSTYSSRFL